MICKLTSPELHLLYLIHTPRRQYSSVSIISGQLETLFVVQSQLKWFQLANSKLYPALLAFPSETTVNVVVSELPPVPVFCLLTSLALSHGAFMGFGRAVPPDSKTGEYNKLSFFPEFLLCLVVECDWPSHKKNRKRFSRSKSFLLCLPTWFILEEVKCR